ncbi:hypothetical protein FLACOL7796_04648 [Flavobacterium collinsii]|uniref:Uncharacterized protein n=1 Tax=Flavobacterium collinsii TaxID=1114861 RepID=A0ABN7ER95_9FLAO|nr:hypothetical protein FLACOL7796_04648 [Flavobacterium collinsii]
MHINLPVIIAIYQKVYQFQWVKKNNDLAIY